MKIRVRKPILLGLLFFAVSILYSCYSINIGANVGKHTGNLTGLAVGSYDGVVNGLENGASAGTAAGISAEDTAVALGNEIKKIGSLEVLQLDVNLTDVFSIGSGTNSHHALLVFEGTAWCTVDLTQCKTITEGETIKIFAPKPVLHVDIDPRGTQKKAESEVSTLSQLFNNGNTLNTYGAYLNSLEITEKKVRENLVGYETLLKSAEKSAKTTIENLAKSAMLNGKLVSVEFYGDDDKIEVEE